jgi:hypothetical protein
VDLDAISQLLIALCVLDWVVTGVLVSAALRLPEAALEERAATSVVLSVAATAAAGLGAFRLGLVTFSPEVRLFLIVAVLVLVSVPQFVWLALLFLGRFR